MSRPKHTGRCYICLEEGQLTYEHVPPEASGNDRPVVKEKFETWLKGSGWTGKGKKQQRGAGEHTLCDKCNNNTGSWYGSEYTKWAAHGRTLLPRIPPAPLTDAGLAVFQLSQVHPLRFAKQVVTMIFSANSPEFTEKNPELADFVRQKQAQGLPSKYQLYMSLLRGNHARYVGVGGIMRIDKGDYVVLSEVAHPPFGFVMTFDSPPPDQHVRDGRITQFVDLGYDDVCDLEMLLPTGEIYSPYASDNRAQSQFKRGRGELVKPGR